jgi:hypothetical protein
LSIVSKYKDGDIRRVGEPKISEVDVVLSGETADIQACVNEDGWSAKQKGKKIPAPKLGPKPWIAQATQTDGAWILTDVGGKDDKGKVC